MSQYGILPVTPQHRIDAVINRTVIAADRILNNKLFMMKHRMSIQMLLLENGPDYIDNIMNSILHELESSEVLG